MVASIELKVWLPKIFLSVMERGKLSSRLDFSVFPRHELWKTLTNFLTPQTALTIQAHRNHLHTRSPMLRPLNIEWKPPMWTEF